MNYDTIKDKLQELGNCIELWQSDSKVPSIERDLILETLRTLYSQLKDCTVEPQTQHQTMNTIITTTEQEQQRKLQTEICEEQELIITTEQEMPQTEQMKETQEKENDSTKEVATTQEDGIQSNSTTEHLKAESEEQIIESTSTDSEDKTDNTTEKEEDTKLNKHIENIQPIDSNNKTNSVDKIDNTTDNEPVNTSKKILFGQDVTTETINDFVRELFWRDETFFNNEVAKLDNMSDFDQVLIYIGQKYNWSGTNETAEKFVALLSQKYL
ncbi:MAG: hypothetical protein RR005_00935 [Mucinivorans sp.]